MLDDILLRVFFNQTAVLIIVAGLLLGLAEVGYRFGRATFRRDADLAQNHSGTIQAAVLGLLGLLLGFTFAMSVARHDARRQVIVDEANTIGTTWLRADFLAGPTGAAIREMLEEYTELHIEQLHLDNGTARYREVRERVAVLQRELWKQGAEGAKIQNSPLATSFITSLNETIDLDASRLAARANHVPGLVWMLLLIVSGCSAWSSGYASGAGGSRSLFAQVVFPVLISVVIMIISDIDRPRRGLIGISEKPLTDLLEMMQDAQP